MEALHKAWKMLKEQQEEMKEKYANSQKQAAKELRVGDYVSVRVLNPTKGQSKWESGYQVLTNHEGGLRVERLRDGRVIRLNQSDARPLPPAKPYEVVDPLPRRVEPTGTDSAATRPQEAAPLPAGAYALAPEQYPSAREWTSWLEVVKRSAPLQ